MSAVDNIAARPAQPIATRQPADVCVHPATGAQTPATPSAYSRVSGDGVLAPGAPATPPWTASTGWSAGKGVGRKLPGSRGGLLSGASCWNTPPPSRGLTRTPSQDNLITKLRYKQVLDWIGALPLPHIKALKGPIKPELLQDGNLLWDIALHVLRPDLPNNRDEIERVEDVISGTGAASDIEKKCRALRDLGHCYHRMGLYGSALEMHAAQLHFASFSVTGGHTDLMQEAIGDLGDVFRTLGEKQIAQNVYKSSIGLPAASGRGVAAKRQKSPVRGSTPGDLQPWPNTPDAQEQRKPSGQRSANWQSKVKPSKKTVGEHPTTLYQRYTFDEEPDDPDKLEVAEPGVNADPFAGMMKEMDDTALTSARRVTDVLNLIREVCGVSVADVWPHRQPTDIKLSCASRGRPASRALTISLSSHPTSHATTAATNVQRQPLDSENSDGDEYGDDFLERPGTGVLGGFESNNGVNGVAVFSGHEAMWLAWYLCWYTKKCDEPPPDKNSVRQRQRISSAEEFPSFEPPPPPKEQLIEPNMDFEARFGHLRQLEVIPPKSRESITKGSAKWHDNALDFVRLSHEKTAKNMHLEGIRTSLHGSPTRDRLVDSTLHGAKDMGGHAKAWKENELMRLDFRGQGVTPPSRLMDGRMIPTPSSNVRSTRSSSRPKSRQLSPKRWDSHEDEGSRSHSPKTVKTLARSPAAQAEVKRPFSESHLFPTDPGDDGFPEKVSMSDSFSWQKLDAVTVSSMSSCGKYSILTLVAGSKVGVFTLSPFRRIAEIHRKDASFTCAHANVEMSFVRSVTRVNAASNGLRVDVPDTMNAPNESDNFIAAGESLGRVIIANARSGVTRHTLVKEREALGSVILLKLVGQGSSGMLYCAHKYGTLTLWSIEGTPNIIWRTQACGSGRSLSGALLLRSCVVTRDDDETCLRIWKMKSQRSKSSHGMLPHDVLHQHTRIAAFTGIQEPRNGVGSDPMIVSGGTDGTLQVWGSGGTLDKDAPTLLFGHTKSITCLFAQSRTRICSGAADHTCRVWNLALAKCALTLGAHDTPITNVWCDDHQILTVASDGRLRVWSNTGTCICVLEGEVNQESRASPPKEIVVFHKPLVFAVLDVNGGVTIWCRDNDGPDASTVPSTGLSPFGDKRRAATTALSPKTGALSLPDTVPGNGASVRGKTTQGALASASFEQMMNSATPSTVNARRLTLATGTGSFQEDSLDVTHEQSEAQSAMQIPLHVPRRKWWGSREDRVIQLWPTGRPWESIVKEKKQRPVGVRSQTGTPSTANSSRRQRRSKSVEAPDLGRMTSPSPFSPPSILPKVPGSQNYPIWMGRGMFMPDVAPSHYPGTPRRSGSPEIPVSLDSSRRTLVAESIQELEGQLRLLNEGSGDHTQAIQQLEFFKDELRHSR